MGLKVQKPAPEPLDVPEELPEEVVEEPTSAPSVERTKESMTTMKKIVWVCLINGFAWVWCSYILAAMDKVQIAESLSEVAVREIIGVVLTYGIKSVLENLSKNNDWPDKRRTDDSGKG